MVNPRYLLRFDLFQQLVRWLGVSMHNSRRGRRFLETHLALLEVEADRELERIISAHAEDEAATKQLMLNHHTLLRDARQRSGTPQAVREAYVNLYGGLIFDLPPWLEAVEEQRSLLNRLRRPDRTTRRHLTLLHDALMRATQEKDVPQEIIAQLHNELGAMLTQSLHFYTPQRRPEVLQRAMLCHRSALTVYTRERYPLQYTKTITSLGTVCQYSGLIGQREMSEQALSYYQEALHICKEKDFAEQWILLQTCLGKSYALRHRGERNDNLELALAHHQEALQHATRASLPTIWATAQVNQGDVYRERIQGEQRTNFQAAMNAYKAALQIYTRANFPQEWAEIHSKLASLYQSYAEDDRAKQDMYLRCAIVCCESAMQVYTPEAFPTERGMLLVKLAAIHRKRPGGDRAANLEQAIWCYHHALNIFTQTSFPTEYRQAQRNLAEVAAERQQYAMQLLALP